MPTKKISSRDGVVGFSKIKSVTLVRKKKPVESKPCTDVKVSNSSCDNKGTVGNNSQAKEISAKSSAAIENDIDSKASLNTPNQVNSLTLLGNYDSSTNSEDSE